MAMPSMGLTPLVMAALEAKGVIARMPWINLPATLAVTGLSLVVSTPACCAIFPQQASISVSSLEPELKAKVKNRLLDHTASLIVLRRAACGISCIFRSARNEYPSLSGLLLLRRWLNSPHPQPNSTTTRVCNPKGPSAAGAPSESNQL